MLLFFLFLVYVLIDCLLLIYCGFLGNRETRDLENEENANSPVNSVKT